MDLGLPVIGINTGLVFIIVLLTQGIKKLDKTEKFKKLYILIPLILGIAAAFVSTDPLTAKEVIINSVIYAGVSGYFYKSGKLIIEKGKNERDKRDERKKENQSSTD